MKSKAISNQHQKKLQTISTYLKVIRINETLTQLEVSQETGLHRNTISNAENAKISLDTLLVLCEYFNIHPSELFSILDD